MRHFRPGSKRWVCLVVVLQCLITAAAYAQHASNSPLRTAASSRLRAIFNPIMEKAVADGNIPGGVLLVGHNGRVIYRRAFGNRSLEPVRERMTPNTIFDLASLTKCVATTTSMMKLVEEGRVRLNDPVAAYLPEFAQNGKQDITIRELMTHYSGLAPDLDLQAAWAGRDTAFAMAMAQKPINPPGSRFLYSDINFEVLGFVVEKVSGESLDTFTKKNIFAPLGMNHTRFLPPENWRPRIAPTQYDEQHNMLRGIVHDPTARRMGGIAGHAGLFSTADDLAIFAQDLLSGFKVLSPAAVEKMTTPQTAPNAPSVRGLGWDIDSPFASNRGELLPVGSFGHTGFTGTSLWIDRATDTYIVLLTNAVHPHGGKSVVSLRSRLATAVVHGLALTVKEKEKLRLARITGYNESLMAAHRITARIGSVKNGIDVLEEHEFRELRSAAGGTVKIGLVTNQAGLDARGQRTIDVLAHAPGLQLAAIFSPEHGISGSADTSDINNSRDGATGAPVISVYGSTEAKRRPPTDSMRNLDVIVFDIQDIGVRFYTYETSLGYFLEGAAKAGKPIIVLDRPNPITGALVYGAVADPDRESFVSYWQTPIQHGMTMGELAKMFNAERGINAKLSVIPMEGWMRGDWFDSTGELWVNPSPNMRSLTEAILYPGTGLIETTNISVGRGTDTPFEVIGAPWIVPQDLARELNAREIGGVRFVPEYFTPASSVYAGEKCGGVNIVLTDRLSLDAPELGLEVASALQRLYPGQFKLTGLDALMVNKASFDALASGKDPRRIAESWRDAQEHFKLVRARYLLY